MARFHMESDLGHIGALSLGKRFGAHICGCDCPGHNLRAAEDSTSEQILLAEEIPLMIQSKVEDAGCWGKRVVCPHANFLPMIRPMIWDDSDRPENQQPAVSATVSFACWFPLCLAAHFSFAHCLLSQDALISSDGVTLTQGPPIQRTLF
jgi:hypothetical protein